MNSSGAASAKETFTSKETARIAGLSPDMLNYLARYGIVTASGNDRRARGHARRYLYVDLLLLRVIARLLENGVSVLRLRKALDGLKTRQGSIELLTKRFVVTDGYNLFLQDGGVAELLETGQLSFAFVLELRSLRAELTAAIVRQNAA